MPSYLHEVLVELFRYRPSLVADLLDDPFEIKLPGWNQARLESEELPELAPTQRRADAVVLLTAGEEPVLAVVIEVQLRPDRRKRQAWPAYLATLHARLRCPTMLLVLCPDDATARWCAAPIEVGHPGWILYPLVLGPDRVPVVVDPHRAAENPELAVLSSIAHANRPEQRDRVFEALLAALYTATDEHATLYYDLVLSSLSPAARQQWEALMSTGLREYRSNFVRKNVNQGRAEGRAEGRVKGLADAVLAVLTARGVDVPEPARQQILDCTDHDQLDRWTRRAATANSIDDVLLGH